MDARAVVPVVQQPAGGGRLHGIQMLRGLAALAVVTHHMLRQSDAASGRFSPDWLTGLGESGVDIFFVISGFIMLTVAFDESRGSPPPGRFLLQRATRIYPFYWVCCAAMLLLGAQHLGGGGVVAALLLLPQGPALIFVAWTLVYELYFYLVFAVTLVWRSRLISAAAATLAILALYAGGRIWAVPFLGNPLPLEFCLGLWLGVAFAARRDDWRVPAWLSVVGFVLLAAALIFVLHRHGAYHPSAARNTSAHPVGTAAGLFRVVAWGLPAVLIAASFLSIGPPRGRLARWMVLGGDASYATYLVQVFPLQGYGWLLAHTRLADCSQIFIVPIAALSSACLGIAAHLAVEKRLIAATRFLLKP